MGVAGAVEDPVGEAVVVVEGGGSDLQDGFGAVGSVPEFFGAFDAVVDFLDERFNHRRRDRQTSLAILRIVHAGLVVREVRDGAGHDAAGIVRAERFVFGGGIFGLPFP